MKVFFDATVWCGAVVRPEGINAKLLDLASLGGPLRGATSDVVLLEFYRHAVEGTLGTAFDPDDIWDYIDAHRPLIDIEQASIGRRLPERTDLHNLPVGEIVFHLTGHTREDLIQELGDQPTLADFDASDLHVLVAAAQSAADAICSSDKVFEPIGEIEIFTPGRLASEFGL